MAVLAVCGLVSPLLAGSPGAQAVEGASPLSPTNLSDATPSDVAGLQTTPQQASAGAPGTGSNYFNTTAVRTERGVAGSGLPREKVTEVDSKTLARSKTDGKFSTSLLDADIKTVAAVKPQAKHNDAESKGEGKEKKPAQSGKKSSSDSTKAATANKTDGSH
jgi:hypothetical protein